MKMLKIASVFAIGSVLFLAACEPNSENYSRPSSDRGLIYEGPFAVRYLTSKSAEVNYDGKTYQISNAINHSEYPFQYLFEDDGDIDLTLNGREYEIENPEDAFDDAMDDLFSKTHKRKEYSYKTKTSPRSTSISLFRGSRPASGPAKSQPARKR